MKFKYLDKVKIIEGFYRGLAGTLMDGYISVGGRVYDVEIGVVRKNKEGIKKTVTIKEEYLEIRY